MIAILGMEELSEDDRTAVHRARRLQRFPTQPLTVAEAFTGTAGAHVPLSETLRGFQEIVDGLHDGVPEQAFYMAGTIDDAAAWPRACLRMDFVSGALSVTIVIPGGGCRGAVGPESACGRLPLMVVGWRLTRVTPH